MGYKASPRERARQDEIRALRESGVSIIELAKRYGVSKQRIQQITGKQGHLSAQVLHAEMIAAYESGVPVEDIAQKYNRTVSATKLIVGCKAKTAEDRFWSNVDKSGDCWMWTGSGIPAGYGHFNVAGRCVYAHRFSYELHYGEIPAGMEVCHRCDVPGCVRPDHLFAATHLENIRDRDSKGRGRPRGKPARVGEGA